jgi:hypothetical protein
MVTKLPPFSLGFWGCGTRDHKHPDSIIYINYPHRYIFCDSECPMSSKMLDLELVVSYLSKILSKWYAKVLN